MSGGSKNLNSVFYAGSYHPIQAGSIDGTDIVPHDNAIFRAQLSSSIGFYDPFGDPKAIGDPYCTLFVARLSRFTSERTLHKVMSEFGRVKNLRLVRDIVTGASRGYAFVEFESEREMRRAYMKAHHLMIDDCEIIVDYNRQQLMPGWIPRRLGGGLSGKKESGQLRFGGREKPFRAPLKPIPYEDLKKLGIPPPPEGRYMTRFQVPSPPRRERNLADTEDDSRRRGSNDRNITVDTHRNSVDIEERHYKRSSSERRNHRHDRSSSEKEHRPRRSTDTDKHSQKRKERDEYTETDKHSRKRKERDEYTETDKHSRKRKERDESTEKDKHSGKRKERDESSRRREKHSRHSSHED